MMNNQIFLTPLDKIILSFIAQKMGDDFTAYFKSQGLNEADINSLDTKGALIFWKVILDDYIERKSIHPSYYLYDTTIFICKLTLTGIHDQQLKEQMLKFIDCQSVANAVETRKKLINVAGEDFISSLFEKIVTILPKDTTSN